MKNNTSLLLYFFFTINVTTLPINSYHLQCVSWINNLPNDRKMTIHQGEYSLSHYEETTPITHIIPYCRVPSFLIVCHSHIGLVIRSDISIVNLDVATGYFLWSVQTGFSSQKQHGRGDWGWVTLVVEKNC